jgi:Uma2 family endonuclease
MWCNFGKKRKMTDPSMLPRLPNLSTLNSPAILEITWERNLSAAEFYKLCCAYPDYRFEKTIDGKLVVSTPLGLDDGFLEGEIIGILSNWRKATKTGISLSASPSFKLPDGSFHSASSAWICNEKIAALTPEQRKRFAPIVPDFVIEVRSSSDRIARLKKKMSEVWI